MGSHQQGAGEGRSSAFEFGHGFCSLTDSLFPYEEEGEKDEFRVFDHFVGDIEVHVPRSFGFENISTTGDVAVGFGDDGLCVTVYKLKGVSGFHPEGVEHWRTTSLDPVPLAFHLYWILLMVIEPLAKAAVSPTG